MPQALNNPVLVSVAISTVLFLLALWGIFRLIIEIVPFTGESRRLSDDLAQAAFSNSGRIRKAANTIIGHLREAANSRETLLLFDPDRKLNTLRGIVAGSLVQARALAGILILTGLLATLWNLRTSVYELKNAFKDIKQYSLDRQSQAKEEKAHPGQKNLGTQGQTKNEPVIDHSKLPAGMENVAGSSVNAFKSSFVAILFAALVLLSASLTQAKAAAALRAFAEWIYQHHETALSQCSTVDQAQSVAKLADSVERFAEASAGFDKLANELSRLNAFGDKFDRAAVAIQESVTQLPGQVNLSFQGLSQEVATGIAGELRNVIEHIGRLYAIFGQQELRLKQLQDFMGQLVQSNSEVAAVVGKLSSVPEHLEDLVDAVSATSKVASELKPVMQSLDAKVAKLPADALKEAADSMKRLEEQLGPLEQQLGMALHDLELLLKSWRSEIGTALGDTVGHFKELQARSLQEIRSMFESANVEEAQSKLKSVEQNIISMSAILRKISTSIGQDQDHSKLKEVLNRVENHLRQIEEMSGRSLLDRWFGRWHRRGTRSAGAGR
jgi:hypothetical protein